MFSDITAPYRFLESWIYDRAVAPAVSEMFAWPGGPLLRLAAALPADARLLDVGCGGGQMASALAARHGGWKVTGLELSADQVRRARKRASALGGRVDFSVGSALDLPFRAATFDAVLSVGSIKHWPDRVRGLRECLRVLKPCGALLVAEVDRECRAEDRQAFVARQRVPRPLRPLAMIGFRLKVAARSIAADDAAALFDTLPVAVIEAGPLPGMPFWMVMARKR